MKLVEFAALCLLMLVTGVFWGTWFTLTRSLDTFPSAEFVHIGQTIIANVAGPMRVLLPACILALVVAAWFHARRRSAGRYLVALSAVLLVAALAITLSVNVPIDNEIREWTPTSVPADWEARRARWGLFHTIRTWTCVAAFACLAAGVLAARRSEGAPSAG